MTDEFDCDVLIVGGGPTGVTLGLLAAQYGAKVLVCEKEADVYPLPRAAHVDHEVMRVFQAAGVADAIMATSRHTSHYDFLTADGQILLRFEGSDRIGPGGWPAANMIHQPSIERLLREKLAGQKHAELRARWSFTSFREDGDGVTALFSSPEGERQLRTRFLVGADGARSPVRDAAGIGFDDLDFDEPWLVIDAIVHDFSRLPKVNLQICDPERPTTCVLMGEGRHRWEFMIKPGELPEQVLDDDFIARLLEPWHVDGAMTVERKAVYRFKARVAQTWRKGRVLLAGDAAHQTPPFAGQGMCAGIRDAANLGWKLGLVAQGNAPDSILDSYQIEREPHARATIAMAMMMGRTVCITDPEAAAERDRQMLAARAAGQSPDGEIAWPPLAAGFILADAPGAGTYFPQPCAAGAEGLKLDEILGPGPWLICKEGPEVPHGDIGAVSLTTDRLRPFADDIARWLGEKGVEAVLVRPDRYVFGGGRVEDLDRAWQAAHG